MDSFSGVALEFVALVLTSIYLVRLLYIAWREQTQTLPPSCYQQSGYERGVKLSLLGQRVLTQSMLARLTVARSMVAKPMVARSMVAGARGISRM